MARTSRSNGKKPLAAKSPRAFPQLAAGTKTTKTTKKKQQQAANKLRAEQKRQKTMKFFRGVFAEFNGENKGEEEESSGLGLQTRMEEVLLPLLLDVMEGPQAQTIMDTFLEEMAEWIDVVYKRHQ